MKRDIRDYIKDIVDSINSIESFTRGLNYASFSKDAKTVLAVVKSLEIIGEASRKIPLEVKNKHKNIPWKQLAGMRNKLVHEYFGIDKEIVWKTAKKDIPSIKPAIKEILKRLQSK